MVINCYPHKYSNLVHQCVYVVGVQSEVTVSSSFLTVGFVNVTGDSIKRQCKLEINDPSNTYLS